MSARAATTSLLLAAILSACGAGSPPVVSDLALSSLATRAGEEVFARFVATDPDGDLDQGSVIVTLAREEGAEGAPSRALPIEGVEEGETRLPLIVGLTPPEGAAPGDYEVIIEVSDNEGVTSEPARAPLELLPRALRARR